MSETATFLLVSPGTAEERRVPIRARMFIGRECSGVAEEDRLVIDHPEVSRNHLEIRLDPERERASAIDTSTNGTRLNGVRLERTEPVTIRSGDRLTVGPFVLEFRSFTYRDSGTIDSRRTTRPMRGAPLVLVVGDIIDYSRIFRGVAGDVLAQSLDELFAELRALLGRHRGTMSDYAGDAIFGFWELEHTDTAASDALDFAIAAVGLVERTAAGLPLRDPERQPLRMGWALVAGDGLLTTIGSGRIEVVGDVANLVFRMSGQAGREGRPPILVSESLAEAAAGRPGVVAVPPLTLKGWTEPVAALGLDPG